MRKMLFVGLGLVILAFIIGGYFYPVLPDMVTSHWDIHGNANGFVGKAFGLFFMPSLMLVLLGLFIYLPTLDPLRENYKSFQAEYDNLVGIIIAYMFYVYLLMLANNLGYSFNIVQCLAPAFAVLFFYIGVILKKAKQNWFIGVRTPWTLSSATVWDKTHRICSKLFKAAGIIALVGLVFPAIGLMASVAFVVATAAFAFAYSYVEFRKEKDAERLHEKIQETAKKIELIAKKTQPKYRKKMAKPKTGKKRRKR